MPVIVFINIAMILGVKCKDSSGNIARWFFYPVFWIVSAGP